MHFKQEACSRQERRWESFIDDAHTINKLSMLLDDEFTESILHSIKLTLQLSKLNPTTEYYRAIKQELTCILAEVGLTTMWMYQKLLLSYQDDGRQS